MCLIVFSYQKHERYKLILAGNRDEFYARPTKAAHFWDEHPDLLAGRDLQAGGTWMGIRKDGRFGALTNYRDPSIDKIDPPSRGDLVTNYLSSEINAKEYLGNLNAVASKYNGFNILLLDNRGMFHFSNLSPKISEIDAGIHGLSNALLNTPWPKLETAKSDLEAITSNANLNYEDLFEILKNDRTAEDDHLPKTGIPYEWEKAISSVFIKTESYGTRCSTLLLVDYNGEATFIERRYDRHQDIVIGENSFTLSLPT